VKYFNAQRVEPERLEDGIYNYNICEDCLSCQTWDTSSSS